MDNYGLQQQQQQQQSLHHHQPPPPPPPQARVIAKLLVSNAAAGAVIGRGGGAIRAPGMLESHYAPEATLRLNAASVACNEAVLAFGPVLPGAATYIQLSASGDTTEAAANLFAGLRALDALVRQRGLSGIAAMPIPETGLGAAINDRLRRAAAPRPPTASPADAG